MHGDLRLVRAYLRGDTVAFERLFARHEAGLHRFAYHLTGNGTEADDLGQSAWLHALQSLSSYAGHSSFRAWLHGIALNLYRDQRRKPKLPTVDLDPEQPSARVGSDPQQAAERREEVMGLYAALAELTPEHREVILLVKVQGFSYQEAATALGCPVGTIRSRVHHAMAALRAALVVEEDMEVHHDVQPCP